MCLGYAKSFFPTNFGPKIILGPMDLVNFVVQTCWDTLFKPSDTQKTLSRHPLYICRHLSNTFQTNSAHNPDTLQTPKRQQRLRCRTFQTNPLGGRVGCGAYKSAGSWLRSLCVGPVLVTEPNRIKSQMSIANKYSQNGQCKTFLVEQNLLTTVVKKS